jgi:uncharacterized RDD family membrane protein YckC
MDGTIYRANGDDVTFTRRFFGDNWLEGLLQVVTLFIGWLIWFAVVAPKGQTPAKQLLGVRIHDYATGEVASAGRVWMREIVGKFGIYYVLAIGAVLSAGDVNASNLAGLYFVAAGILLLMSDERRAVWDYAAGTILRHHPHGVVGPPIAASTQIPPERRQQEMELLRQRQLRLNPSSQVPSKVAAAQPAESVAQRALGPSGAAQRSETGNVPVLVDPVCVRCGRINREPGKYCFDCGQRLTQRCSNCNQTLVEDGSFCGACGVRLVTGTPLPGARS